MPGTGGIFETAQDGILILDAAKGQVVDANTFRKDCSAIRRRNFLGRTTCGR